MASFTSKLDGPAQTIARLRACDKKLRRSILGKTGRAMAKPIKAAMIRNAPIDSKTWRKSIGTKVKQYAQNTIVAIIVGPRSQYIALVVLKAKYYRDAQGRVRKIVVTEKTPERFSRQKRRPVLYSHRAEKKYGMIRRTEQQTMAASQESGRAVLEELVEST